MPFSRHNVAIFGIGAEDTSSDERLRSTLFIVMEFLAGGSLKSVIMEQMVEWNVSYGTGMMWT